MIGPILLQQAIDHYILPGNFSGLLWLIGGYLLLLVAGFWANYWELIQLETVGQRIIADIKNRAFRHLLNLELPFFDQSPTGKLVSRIENDANAMKVLFTSVITHLLSNGLLMVGMFIIMAWQYDLRLAAWIVGLCPLMLVGALLFNRMMAPRLVTVRAYVAEVNSFLTEMIQGITTLQVFAREAETLQALKTHSWNKYRLERFTNIAFNSFFNF
jgi:ATP-binding cassette subfamily B protein